MFRRQSTSRRRRRRRLYNSLRGYTNYWQQQPPRRQHPLPESSLRAIAGKRRPSTSTLYLALELGLACNRLHSLSAFFSPSRLAGSSAVY